MNMLSVLQRRPATRGATRTDARTHRKGAVLVKPAPPSPHKQHKKHTLVPNRQDTIDYYALAQSGTISGCGQDWATVARACQAEEWPVLGPSPYTGYMPGPGSRHLEVDRSPRATATVREPRSRNDRSRVSAAPPPVPPKETIPRVVASSAPSHQEKSKAVYHSKLHGARGPVTQTPWSPPLPSPVSPGKGKERAFWEE